jgi:hypothetical protein
VLPPVSSSFVCRQRFPTSVREQDRLRCRSCLLHGLKQGEPWQQRVLLRGSPITLEQWLQRRMLRPARCHFCCG